MGSPVEEIIIAVLWGIISLSAFIQYAHLYKELSLINCCIVVFIFLIGGPIFALSNILTTILDYIFPEGWDSQ